MENPMRKYIQALKTRKEVNKYMESIPMEQWTEEHIEMIELAEQDVVNLKKAVVAYNESEKGKAERAEFHKKQAEKAAEYAKTPAGIAARLEDEQIMKMTKEEIEAEIKELDKKQGKK